MNLIPKICELLGVEIGEEFDLCNGMDSCIRMGCIYKFSDACLMFADEGDECCFGVASDKTLRCILNGSLKIIKLPFKPKDGESYWLVRWGHNQCIDIGYGTWTSDDIDYRHLYCGNCFRTRSEAAAHKFEIYEKLTGKKWEE